MASFLEPYGKIDEADQARLDARRKTRKRIAIIALSSLLLFTIILTSVLGTRYAASSSNSDRRRHDDAMKSVSAVCGVTLYKDSCYDSLSAAAKSGNLHPEDLFKLSIQVAIGAVQRASEYFSRTSHNNYDNATSAAIGNCMELLDLASDHLNDSYSSSAGPSSVLDVVDDVRTWLSSAATYQDTCIDGLREAGMGDDDMAAGGALRNSTELTSNSLAIVTRIEKVAGSLRGSESTVARRRLLGRGEYRDLVEKGEDLKTKADAVVGKGGKYATIGKALKAVPKKSKERFVIYVKKGVYKENVKVEKSMWNVVMVGDGMDATIVTGSLNVVDGTPTFSTATFAVFGKGFIARDMGFKNTAGPAKHQAVALMSNADQSVFYRCSFDAYQDTLYSHANRQFYRECNITGTVDFIFGNSAVIIQNSNILPRVPMSNQKNIITAQGKSDPNQNTGIAIQNCKLLPYKGDFKGLSSVKNYLGRPWKNYSTTVYVGSEMGSLIDPQGWLPWSGSTAPPTIYYAEYGNYGPGASTKNRVKWKGVKYLNKKEAERFSVKAFIQGDKWIPNSGAAYN